MDEELERDTSLTPQDVQQGNPLPEVPTELQAMQDFLDEGLAELEAEMPVAEVPGEPAPESVEQPTPDDAFFPVEDFSRPDAEQFQEPQALPAGDELQSQEAEPTDQLEVPPDLADYLDQFPSGLQFPGQASVRGGAAQAVPQGAQFNPDVFADLGHNTQRMEQEGATRDVDNQAFAAEIKHHTLLNEMAKEYGRRLDELSASLERDRL